jgi:hypothetical protein
LIGFNPFAIALIVVACPTTIARAARMRFADYSGRTAFITVKEE